MKMGVATGTTRVGANATIVALIQNVLATRHVINFLLRESTAQKR